MKETFKRLFVALLVVCVIAGNVPSVLGTTVNAAVRLNAQTKTLDIGSSFVLKIKGTSKKVKWSSSKKSIVKVSTKGKITGVKVGTAKVTAKIGSKKYICKVTVRPVLNKKIAWVAAGETFSLKMKGTKKTVKWRTSNSKIATVSSKGVVKTKAKGEVVIKAIIGSKSYKCNVTVWKKGSDETVEYIKEVVRLVNVEREKRGLKKLKLNMNLCDAAMYRTRELDDKFSHTRPNGKKYDSVLPKFDLEINSVNGENIAVGYTEPKSVMKAWMNSKSHRECILDKEFTDIGVGVVNIGGYRYWTQMFYGVIC